MRTTVLLLAAAAAFAAEPAARLTTPVLGYVFDAGSKSLRPIAGIPGSASLEGALASATKLEIGFVSQNGAYAFAGTLDGAVLINLRSQTSTEIQGAPADIALGAWSPDSRSVAIWTRSGKLQVWSGFPESPALQFSADAENPAGVAVADRGNLALFWNEAGLNAVDAQGSRQVASGPIAAAAFRSGSTEWAAVTDSQLLRSNADPAMLEISKAAAIAFGSHSLLIGGENAIAVIDDTGTRTIACDCSVTALDRLAGTDVFRLTNLDAPSLAIYDGDSAEARILYIPTEGGR